MDVVEHGIARPAHASECMTVLFQEIKEKSSQQKYKNIFKKFLFEEKLALFEQLNNKLIFLFSD